MDWPNCVLFSIRIPKNLLYPMTINKIACCLYNKNYKTYHCYIPRFTFSIGSDKSISISCMGEVVYCHLNIFIYFNEAIKSQARRLNIWLGGFFKHTITYLWRLKLYCVSICNYIYTQSPLSWGLKCPWAYIHTVFWNCKCSCLQLGTYNTAVYAAYGNLTINYIIAWGTRHHPAAEDL